MSSKRYKITYISIICPHKNIFNHFNLHFSYKKTDYAHAQSVSFNFLFNLKFGYSAKGSNVPGAPPLL